MRVKEAVTKVNMTTVREAGDSVDSAAMIQPGGTLG